MLRVACSLLLIGVATTRMAVAAAYAPTPQSAAQRVVYSSHGSKVVIVRTNIVGSYATVLIHGGYVEGSSADDAALLVKHFSFGWQVLESLNFRCRVNSQIRSTQARAQLMRRMPAPIDDDRACGNGNLVDTGPPAAIDAIRRLEHGPFVPSVVVSGKYALAQWYGAGGGETLFEMRADRWHTLRHGGGALGVAEMREYGVPQSAWCPFGIYDAKCGTPR